MSRFWRYHAQMNTTDNISHCNPPAALPADLAAWVKTAATALGFAQASISQPDLTKAREGHLAWLAKGWHGDMDYMTRNIDARFDPALLVPETVSIIHVTLPYVAAQLGEAWMADAWQVMDEPTQGYVSRYALGRDYHKVVRNKLQQLAHQIEAHLLKTAPDVRFAYRAFADSAPVPEVEMAQQTALGWRGKHTLLLNRTHGSMFFLGELYVNLDLKTDDKTTNHCGQCTACIDVCPTQAIVAPYRVDARRCISYLTIEFKGEIPHEFRAAIGNRIYGCDDCQLACPWNKFAQRSELPDFAVRNGLDGAGLLDLLAWDEPTFKTNTAGSPIHRIGHIMWQRNILLALGNAPKTAPINAVLQSFLEHENTTLKEQAQWSFAQNTLP